MRLGAASEKQDIETRLSRLERVFSNRILINMRMQLDALQGQLRFMQGASEETAHALDVLKQRQRDLYMDIDRRLAAIMVEVKQLAKGAVATATLPTEGAAVTAASGNQGNQLLPNDRSTVAGNRASTSAISASTVHKDQVDVVPTVLQSEPELSPLKEQEVYESALAILRKGDYEAAQKAFAGFITRYPQGGFTDNAYYWMGEASYVMRRYQDAIVAFDQVQVLFPNSPKVPAAMLKSGFSHYGLKHWDKARERLETVKQRFPQGSVAQLAEKRLHRMKIEGH